MLYVSLKSEIHPPHSHFNYRLCIISDQIRERPFDFYGGGGGVGRGLEDFLKKKNSQDQIDQTIVIYIFIRSQIIHPPHSHFHYRLNL